jgi:hypothetical protein
MSKGGSWKLGGVTMIMTHRSIAAASAIADLETEVWPPAAGNTVVWHKKRTATLLHYRFVGATAPERGGKVGMLQPQHQSFNGGLTSPSRVPLVRKMCL